jgi:cytochrome c5
MTARPRFSGPALARAAITGLVAAMLLWTEAAVPAASPAVAADDDLPDGPGKRILDASCTSCHGLDLVTQLKGAYTRAQWRAVVVSMVDMGATVAPADVEVLTDYLDEHLGKK